MLKQSHNCLSKLNYWKLNDNRMEQQMTSGKKEVRNDDKPNNQNEVEVITSEEISNTLRGFVSCSGTNTRSKNQQIAAMWRSKAHT